MHVDRYDFGLLVVDGRYLHSDVLMTSDGVLSEHWWRRESHVLCLDDLRGVLKGQVRRLVVGTGAYGRMQPATMLERQLADRGIAMEALPTSKAVERVNELLVAGAADWAAALHLTC